MLKIKYNGYEVEVDTVAEAKDLMGHENKVSVRVISASSEVFKRGGRPKGSKNKEKRSDFNKKEITKIRDFLVKGIAKVKISKDKELLRRHTKESIYTKAYKLEKSVFKEF